MIPEVWKKWWFSGVLVFGCVLIALTPTTTLVMCAIAFLWGIVWAEVAEWL